MFESIIVLPEDKHEVFFPVALKCLGYFLFRSLALDVSQVQASLLGSRSPARMASMIRMPDFSRDVRQDKRKFYIHLLHGFLHTQDYA